MRITKDGHQATLEIHGKYSAEDLEKLIAELSALRSGMTPAVPMGPPMTNHPEDAAAARARGDPCVQVAVMRNGLTRFWVRHAGLGWFGFNLPVERANLLANYILDVTSQRREIPDSFKKKRRQSDLSH